MPHKVKEVADLVGVSVRMLHHYDKIGLLKPAMVSEAGYRLYTEADLEKLQQIMFFRELDFGLQEIKSILESPNFDRREAMKKHKELLSAQKERLEKIIETVDKTLVSLEGGREMDKKEMFGAFDMSTIEEHKAKYAEEARQRWGQTDAYKESQNRAAKYTKEDWAKISTEVNAIYSKVAVLMDAKEPEDPEVQELVRQWQEHISTYFYHCPPEMLRGLGDLYVSDERFTKNIDKYRAGLAAFLRDAMHFFADNAEE